MLECASTLTFSHIVQIEGALHCGPSFIGLADAGLPNRRQCRCHRCIQYPISWPLQAWGLNDRNVAETVSSAFGRYRQQLQCRHPPQLGELQQWVGGGAKWGSMPFRVDLDLSTHDA